VACDVTLVAAVLRDDALAKALSETYLAPLESHGDSGAVLRETLRAYLSAGLNAATAAAALAVDRHTVQRRLRKVEEALGRLLPDCHAELVVALSLEEVEAGVDPSSGRLGLRLPGWPWERYVMATRVAARDWRAPRRGRPSRPR